MTFKAKTTNKLLANLAVGKKEPVYRPYIHVYNNREQPAIMQHVMRRLDTLHIDHLI